MTDSTNTPTTDRPALPQRKPTTPCHAPFPGSVRSYASNSCTTCGGMIEGALSPAHLAEARYLGADAALSTNTWIEMGESDARSILSDIDPEVMDRYPEPTLSEWEEACDETLAQQLGLASERTAPHFCHSGHCPPEVVIDPFATAWEEGRDEVWSDALQATALRVLGDVQAACELERDIENRVDALRIKAERS